jgi:hypothetical protein
MNLTPQPKRRSLADLAAASPQPAIETPRAAAPVAEDKRAPARRSNYPSATVYLPRRAIRLVKEMALEEDRRISDILADAVDEYLQKRGHLSLEQLSE